MSARRLVAGMVAAVASVALLFGRPTVSAAQAPPAGDSLVLRVDGMVCSLCAYGAERRLRRVDGVERVHVDLDNHLVIVTLRRGGAVADSTLEREVRRAGFALRGVTRQRRAPGAEPGQR